MKIVFINSSQLFSPKSPNRNVLTVESCFKSPRKLHEFNIDTPQRKKMMEEGLTDTHQTVLGNGAFGIVYKAYYKGLCGYQKNFECNKNNWCGLIYA